MYHFAPQTLVIALARPTEKAPLNGSKEGPLGPSLGHEQRLGAIQMPDSKYVARLTSQYLSCNQVLPLPYTIP